MAKNKYYAVKKGWKTGVFDNHFEYNEAVSRYPSPIARVFSKIEDAEAWLFGNPLGKNDSETYYAVKIGKNTGIFATAKEMEQQTKGYPGALAKKFKTLEEAEQWLSNGENVPSQAIEENESGNKIEEIYAVKRGHKIGIFIRKDEFEEAIQYFTRPEYKVFSNINEAREWMYGPTKKTDAKRKYYAVKRGRETGLFYSAQERNKSIEKYPGALTKIFTDKEEAITWLNTSSEETLQHEENYYCIRYGPNRGMYETKEEYEALMEGYSELFGHIFHIKEIANLYMEYKINGEEDLTLAQLKKIYDIVAYVDGSIRRDIHWFSYGIVLFHEGKEHHFKQKYTNNAFYEVLSDAGELKGAMKVMKYAKDHGARKVAIFHDSAKIADLANRLVLPTGTAHQTYVDFYDEIISSGIQVTFYKVKAHSGDKYNTIADKLAKEALNFDDVPRQKRKKKEKFRFYAVRKGRIPGVYNTLDEAYQQTVGYSNPDMKGFDYYESAVRWINYNIDTTSDKFYAVKIGRTKGIFTNFEDYIASVSEYPGAIGRSFSALNDAAIWMHEGNSCGIFYAVKKGKRCGIFYDFESYADSVNDYSGSEGKRFNSIDEAILWLNNETDNKTYYVVINGRKPGIYSDIHEFLKQTINYPEAFFRVAATKEDAEQLLQQSVYQNPRYAYIKTSQEQLVIDLNNPKENLLKEGEEINFQSFRYQEQARAYAKGHMNQHFEYQMDKINADFDLVAYVNGSYDAKTGRFSYGTVILNHGQEHCFKQLYKNNPMKILESAAGEIKGAMKCMNYALNNHAKSLVIFYEFIGVETWACEDARFDSSYVRKYRELYQQAIDENIEICFYRISRRSTDKYYVLSKELAVKSLLYH